MNISESKVIEMADPSQALGKIPSGLFVITYLGKDDKPEGMLASWVQQCSLEPLLISIALKAGRGILESLTPGAKFHVHVLRTGQNQLVSRFAKPSNGENRFAELSIHQTADMPPILLDACSVLCCVAQSHTGAGDHRLLLAEVLSGTLLESGDPMVHVRKNGRNY
ncbi:MAG: flavin reductase family protein [Gemmataceae bacterium]